ncbi:uncharacterized protein LOC108622899 [Ceratina calcarata]|uniref:Uncharacterized protein LOC108622899 n=1 Tax=Ceratina calcarata TaxID=156304 RepID=A0AAJ7W9R5_9HYME|nr:uncharacterized protein LOC108622899 [Ceratina calcarata]XP_026667614.1 uncharacterized protein LOC108622899 [Ceratina calcarata]
MRIKVNALRVLLLLFVFEKESEAATKCYQCNSKKDKDCTVNMVDARYLKACPSSQPFCRKAVYIYYFMNTRDYFVVRECAKWRNADRECYRGRYVRDSYQFVCECEGAGCNQSTRFSSKITISMYAFCQFIIFLLRNPT